MDLGKTRWVDFESSFLPWVQSQAFSPEGMRMLCVGALPKASMTTQKLGSEGGMKETDPGAENYRHRILEDREHLKLSEASKRQVRLRQNMPIKK